MRLVVYVLKIISGYCLLTFQFAKSKVLMISVELDVTHVPVSLNQ